jgi:bifunctional non-homologous end joining protein LigD
VRYPDGITGKSFFQWAVPPSMPTWVCTLTFEDEEGRPRLGFLVSDPETLLYVANLAAIVLHILAYRVPKTDEANFLTIDFDVSQSTLKNAVTLAKTLHEILDAIGLHRFSQNLGSVRSARARAARKRSELRHGACTRSSARAHDPRATSGHRHDGEVAKEAR